MKLSLFSLTILFPKLWCRLGRQSGLSVVYIELMDFGGDEIYFVEESKLFGKTFLEAIFSYEDSAVIGLQFADGKVSLNPPMKTRISRGDKIIGITEDDDTMLLSKKRSLRDFRINRKQIIFEEKEKEIRAERILLIGWNHRARTVIKELDNYLPKDSELKVISKFDDAAIILDKLEPDLKHLKLSFEQVNTTDISVLRSLNCTQYDYIILLCYQQYFPMQEADAQTLITLLHLRSISEASSERLNIVSEMLDIRNRQLADVTRADDFIVSDKLLSLLMTQVAENKYLMRVFEDLFDADGSEIYIKLVEDYVKIERPINFYTILESAARRNEIAIGYRIIKHAKDRTHNYGVVVNPVKSKYVQFSEGDKIIVLAED